VVETERHKAGEVLIMTVNLQTHHQRSELSLGVYRGLGLASHPAGMKALCVLFFFLT
jgi:hypothetical protein